MSFYSNCFASYYTTLKKFKNIDFEFHSIGLVFISQILHFGLLISMLQKAFNVIILKDIPSKYYYYILVIPWAILVYLYYSKRKAEIVDQFQTKNEYERSKWFTFSIFSLVIPVVAGLILLSF